MYVLAIEERALTATTIDRRLSTVCGFYRLAHIDGLHRRQSAALRAAPEVDPADARGLDGSELGAFPPSAERDSAADQG